MSGSKRVKLDEDELAIIEGLRHEKSIHNAAVSAALVAVAEAVATWRASNVLDRAIDYDALSESLTNFILRLRR